MRTEGRLTDPDIFEIGQEDYSRRNKRTLHRIIFVEAALC